MAAEPLNFSYKASFRGQHEIIVPVIISSSGYVPNNIHKNQGRKVHANVLAVVARTHQYG
jgi:hypothetical protein